MTKKVLASFLMLFIVLMGIFSVSVVLADVPSVLELTREKENGNTVLVMEIRHNSPSSNHYIDIIEVEIDGEVSQITGLETQTAARFEERYTLPEDATKIQVRAHCNLHGWSPWVSEEKEESSGGGGIPGFPYESIILGLILSSFLIWYLQKKNNYAGKISSDTQENDFYLRE